MGMFADSPTLVDGILTAKTTWTAADSSFEIVGSIQIPQNIIVTIEPGVRVTKTTGGAMFLINGYLVAHGTAENKKNHLQRRRRPNFFRTNHPIAEGFADLDYCIVENGQSAFWFDNTGCFNLTNSELCNLSQNSYLGYPLAGRLHRIQHHQGHRRLQNWHRRLLRQHFRSLRQIQPLRGEPGLGHQQFCKLRTQQNLRKQQLLHQL